MDELNNLLKEEYKRAAKDYNFFHELSLKYLWFYSALISTVTYAFVTLSTTEFKNPTNSETVKLMIEFVQGRFLTLCGIFVIIIGMVTATIILKCRDKMITAIKEIMNIRKYVLKQSGYSFDEFKRYCYHIQAVPRYYQLLSPLQGIVVVISLINSIALISILTKGGIASLFSSENNNLLKATFTILDLSFIQCLFVYQYMMRKDITKVRINFISSMRITEIVLKYRVKRAITNSLFSHLIHRCIIYISGIWEPESLLCLRRDKEKRLTLGQPNIFEKKLIAGHYEVILPQSQRNYNLLIYGDNYGWFSGIVE